MYSSHSQKTERGQHFSIWKPKNSFLFPHAFWGLGNFFPKLKATKKYCILNYSLVSNKVVSNFPQQIHSSMFSESGGQSSCPNWNTVCVCISTYCIWYKKSIVIFQSTPPAAEYVSFPLPYLLDMLTPYLIIPVRGSLSQKCINQSSNLFVTL